jgi:16S rRNA (uracil1498-N3)-methyltransferase
VLRLKAGDRLELIDSAGSSFAASIDTIGATVRATLLDLIAESGPVVPLQIDVAQAVPKGRRMEFVVEKCTELGACDFVPRSRGREAGTVATPRAHRGTAERAPRRTAGFGAARLRGASRALR